MDPIYFGSMILTSIVCMGLAVFFRAEDNPRLTAAWRSELLLTSFWSLGRAMMNFSHSDAAALSWVRFSYLNSVWMAPVYVWVIYELLGRPLPKKIFIALGITCGLTMLTIFTPHFINEVQPKLNFNHYEVPGGIPFSIFSGIYTGSLIWAHILLIKALRTTRGQKRNRVQYFLIATAISFGASATTFPLVHDIKIYPFGVPAIAFAIILLTYSVVRYQVMEVQLLLRDTTVHIISSSIFASFFIFLSWSVNQKWLYLLSQGILVFFLPLSYPAVSRWVRKSINRTRWGEIDRYLEDMEQKAAILYGASFSIRSLSTATLDLMTAVFPVNDVSVYFMRTATGALHLYARKGTQNEFLDVGKNSDYFKALSEMPDVVLTKKEEESANLDEDILEKFFKETRGEILCTVLTNKQLSGLIVIGSKNSLARFHSKDLEALRFLGKKIEIACAFAMASEKYAVVMGEWSHSLNQITKPMEQNAGVIKDFFDLYSGDRIRELAGEILERIRELRQFHDYITNTTAISRELITGEFKKETVNIAQLITKYSQEYESENKGIVSVEIPPSDAQADVNVTGIRRVMTELLSNSLRHTKHKDKDAKIIVAGHPCEGGYEVKVKDNGDGVDPTNIERIWEAGWQTKDMNAGASGLGLSICKQTIEAHGGRVNASSPGKGQGLEISFIIPILNVSKSI
ncbi:MAG: hypothetical protein JW893_06280 [Candidatus Omnitrophica bacterium]|nr:hypothetical protein [Candidatus Omnitrophota bacterium]